MYVYFALGLCEVCPSLGCQLMVFPSHQRGFVQIVVSKLAVGTFSFYLMGCCEMHSACTGVEYEAYQSWLLFKSASNFSDIQICGLAGALSLHS